MTQPPNKDSHPRKATGRVRSAQLTEPPPTGPPTGPPTDPPTDPPPTPPTAVDVVLARFLAIREALRGPAANDPNRNQKLWVIPGFQ